MKPRVLSSFYELSIKIYKDFIKNLLKNLLLKKIEIKIILTYFASKAKANTPAASGAAAEVPLCDLVHLPYKSVVA